MLNKTTPNWPHDYGIRVFDTLAGVAAHDWDQLLSTQAHPTPFMRHAYLNAMQTSGSAHIKTGWSLRVFLLEQGGELRAATVVYVKNHSRGEYVFDHAWANAYAQHGFHYYPKAVCAVPFTPVTGSRLLARSASDRLLLAQALVAWTRAEKLSGLHVLFASDEDLAACSEAGMLTRQTVQFHWNNSATPHTNFDAFLATLSQEKRKKIRQERRKVSDAGVSFQALHGSAIQTEDWAFFYRCYERTYLEHGNLPYLNQDFFTAMSEHMPEDWLLFMAHREGQAIAASLIGLNESCRTRHPTPGEVPGVAYGRYWGALERVDCLHFEACYYQPLQWCMANGYQRFEGGAQGEHKLARALMPVTTHSAHWLEHPDFFEAVDRYLLSERAGIQAYVSELQQHSPLKTKPAQASN